MPSGGLVSNYTAGVYRSKDSIRNFKIKVSLRRATGGSIKDYTDNAENEDGVPLKDIMKLQKKLIQDTDKHKNEEATINWQTKLFSKREFGKYLENSGNSILEKNYHEECKSLNEKGYQSGRLFTYIDADPFQYVDEVNNDIDRIPPKELPNYLFKSKSNIRKRRPLIGKQKSNEDALPKMNIVNYKPTKEQKNPFISTRYQKMYIMADLSPNLDGLAQDNEYVLCTIKVDANGTIIVKPDFNDHGRPYVVETGGFGNEAYEFVIENASNKISIEDLKREFTLHQELYKRHLDYVKNLVGADFNLPQPKILNVHIFGEIISAKNFDYDDLHVYYQLDLPRNWHVDTNQATSGFTTTSRTVCVEDDEIAYFSHPFEFHVYYCNDEVNMNYKDELPHMPKIYFEVASYDSWSRYRTEGYTWLQLRPQPGGYKEKLSCWRPRGDSFIYELRRFFIGGSPELEDISYVAVPSSHEGSLLSRFGFRTTTTGVVDVKLNVLFQSQIFIDKKIKNQKQFQLMDKISNDSKLNDIMNVLEAFNQAKNRMKEARENTRKLIEE